MVITNKGVAIQPCFQLSKHMQFLQNRPMGCVYKTGTKHASNDGIELAVLKAFREVLLEVLSLGFGVAKLVLVHLLAVLLVDGFSLDHTVIYDAHNKHTIKKKK